jgi:hypothetical protein
VVEEKPKLKKKGKTKSKKGKKKKQAIKDGVILHFN